MTRVLSLGECMIELTHRTADELVLGCAGDTFNTAAYLARLTAPEQLRVDYLTVLGDDHYSERVLAAMRAEGIGTELIPQLPGEQPGLYLVRTDADGERHFTYYRSRSAARNLFGSAATSAEFDGYDLVHLSAITLQILAPEARERLHAALARYRDRGGRISFDSNYRPAGWSGRQQAAAEIERFWRLAAIGLPTFSDERALRGDDAPESTVERLRGLGVDEIAVKDGARGCVLYDGERTAYLPTTPVHPVVDSTAAGDAFNAAYLAARLTGTAPAEAVARAHQLAGTVIGHRGAIVADEVLPKRPARARPNG